MSTPLMRVWAVKGMKRAPDEVSGPGPTVRPRKPNFSFASTTMLRPSGVSSAREESWAISASCCGLMFATGMNSTA